MTTTTATKIDTFHSFNFIQISKLEILTHFSKKWKQFGETQLYFFLSTEIPMQPIFYRTFQAQM